jgi:hypothetical protein
MKKELNIAAILKDKPKGTKLWSPIFGDCKFSRLSSESGIRVFPIHNGFTSTEEKSFFKTGQYTLAGEVCLFPSKQMQDWSKFAWKKGDVLVSNDGKETIFFNRFTDDTYTKFFGKYVWGEDVPAYRCFSEKEETLFTKNYSLEENKENIKKHILTAEACILKAGLNLETLETIPLKDGDIYFCKTYRAIKIGIFKSLYEEHNEVYISNYVYYHTNAYTPYLNYSDDDWVDGGIYRPATEEEKQQLFDALAKEGKRWNPDTKQIEDLPKKYELKPFDKVIAKIAGRTWTADFFRHYDENDEQLPYVCIGYGRVTHCIPYNEETKHLLGTADEWKGGEG